MSADHSQHISQSVGNLTVPFIDFLHRFADQTRKLLKNQIKDAYEYLHTHRGKDLGQDQFEVLRRDILKHAWVFESISDGLDLQTPSHRLHEEVQGWFQKCDRLLNEAVSGLRLSDSGPEPDLKPLYTNALSKLVSLESEVHGWLARITRVKELLDATGPQVLASPQFVEWAERQGGPFMVVFTDVVDSTRLMTTHGDKQWGRMIGEHFKSAEDRCADRGGYFLKTLGDGVIAIFRSSHDAVDFAIDMWSRPEPTEFQIRVGVDAGTALVRTGDLWGVTVVKARRLCDAAKRQEVCGGPGVVISDAVREGLDATRHQKGSWNHCMVLVPSFGTEKVHWFVAGDGGIAH